MLLAKQVLTFRSGKMDWIFATKTFLAGMLANVNPIFSWVRLAPPVPVEIMIDELTKNQLAFVAGRTVTVLILKKDQP